MSRASIPAYFVGGGEMSGQFLDIQQVLPVLCFPVPPQITWDYWITEPQMSIPPSKTDSYNLQGAVLLYKYRGRH